jgi:hypothetical protein
VCPPLPLPLLVLPLPLLLEYAPLLLALPPELECEPELPVPEVLPVPDVLPPPEPLPEPPDPDELDDVGSDANPPPELALHAPNPNDDPATKTQTQTPRAKQLRVMRSSKIVSINIKGDAVERTGKLRLRGQSSRCVVARPAHSCARAYVSDDGSIHALL